MRRVNGTGRLAELIRREPKTNIGGRDASNPTETEVEPTGF
jgi:hypothetical protein